MNLSKVIVTLTAVLGAILVSAPGAQAQGNPGPRHALSVLRPGAAPTAGPAAAAAPLPMAYGGGPVLTVPRVYLSFWGPEWGTGFSSGGYTSDQAKAYLTGYFTGVGGTPSLDSVKEYCQGVAVGATSCPPGAVAGGNPAGLLQAIWIDNTPVPTTPADPDVQAAARRAFVHFGDTSGLYFVMTPSQRSETGFGTSWCAWHSYDYANGNRFPFAYLPYIADAGPTCGANYVNPANDGFGHGYFDGYSIVAGHEYAESVTDPFPNSGWIDANGYENADKCAWAAGSANGGPGSQNIVAGGQSYAVQPLWSNRAGTCVLAGLAPPPPAARGPYVPLAQPVRILDTRAPVSAANPRSTALGQREVYGIAILGNPLLPALSNLGSVVVNVTVTDASQSSYLTLFEADAARPSASNINFGAGQTIANLAQVALGPSGVLDVFNSQGSVNVVLDVQGVTKSVADSTPHAGLFQPVDTPARILDTRPQYPLTPQPSSYQTPLTPGTQIQVMIGGNANVTPVIPAASVGAAILNLTVTNPSAAGYLAVYPIGGTANQFSNINFAAGQTIPNRVITAVSGGGFSVFNGGLGTVDVLIDVAGWFTNSSGPTATGLSFNAIVSSRQLDTRLSFNPIGQNTVLAPALQVLTPGAVAVFNVTVTNAQAYSYLTLFPDGLALPNASDLNFGPGQTLANMAVVKVGADGRIAFYNSVGVVDVIADLAGSYS